MKELKLKYGCNPHQANASVYMNDGSHLPFEVLNGNAGYINLLDALNAWQLVKELSASLGLPAAASFKHVSPAGAAIGRVLSHKLKKAYFVDDIENLDESPIACAYARSRGADRMSSFGDFIALSHKCDETAARLIVREVSDGIIAPDYSEEAFKLLCNKKKGKYCIIKMDKDYMPKDNESREIYGITFKQERNNYKISSEDFTNIVSKNKTLPESAITDLTLAFLTLKYTQSNSVSYAVDGQVIGVGAGQQSRIHCVRLAGAKADAWQLRQMDKVINLPFRDDIKRADRDNAVDVYISDNSDELYNNHLWKSFFKTEPDRLSMQEKRDYLSRIRGVSLASDAFFPFEDNIQRAYQSGVSYIIEAGGSIRDDIVIKEADRYGMTLCFNGVRLFHH